MSTVKVNAVRHLSNTGSANIVLESNASTNLQATSTLGLNVTGTLTVSGISTFNGSVQIGDSSTDTVVLTSTVSGFNNFSGFTGEIRMYAGNEGPDAPPAGWLYCNGDTISSTTGNGGTHYNADGKGNDYQPLFNLLKTNNNWGNPDSPSWGTNTVKLPDFRSRSPVGVHTGAANAIGTGSDSASLTTRTLGVTTGAENHILIQDEIPAHLHAASSVNSTTGISASNATINASQPNHTHGLNDHIHPVVALTTTGGDHIHLGAPKIAASDGTLNVIFGSSLYTHSGPGSGMSGGGGSGNAARGPTSTVEAYSSGSYIVPSHNTGISTTTTTAGDGDDAITVNTPAITITEGSGGSGHSHTISTTDTGGGLKHQNLSPIIAVNYIIKV